LSTNSWHCSIRNVEHCLSIDFSPCPGGVVIASA
jgi:hypothetical protein